MFSNFFNQERFNCLEFTLIKIELSSRIDVVFLYKVCIVVKLYKIEIKLYCEISYKNLKFMKFYTKILN